MEVGQAGRLAGRHTGKRAGKQAGLGQLWTAPAGRQA
jgi:hypothetical protein